METDSSNTSPTAGIITGTELIERISQLARKYGFTVIPYEDPPEDDSEEEITLEVTMVPRSPGREKERDAD